MSADNKSSERSLENIVRLEPETPATAERHRQPLDILKLWDINARYMGLRVRLDSDTFRESYSVPGQYTTLQIDEDTVIYLAIASAPGQKDYWDFLIDRASEAGRKLERYDTHRPLMLSPAEGSGYPVADVENRPVFLFTTGSGIASVKPVVEYWANRPDAEPSSISIYYGETNPEDFAYTETFEQWRQRNIAVIRAVENQENSDIAYKYVQHAFEDRAPSTERAAVFISGAVIMVQKTVETLMEHGVEPSQLYTNI